MVDTVLMEPGTSELLIPDLLPELLEESEERQLEGFFTSGDYWLQDKKNGDRQMARCDERGIFGQNRKGQLGELPEHLRGEIRAFTQNRACLLDGELVGTKDTGYTYWLFDLLMMEQHGRMRDMRHEPYGFRLGFLTALWEQYAENQPHVKIVPTFFTEADKRREFKFLDEMHAEGVVFKNRHAPYVPGYSAQHWKWKFWLTATCRVKANKVRGKDSVLLEMLDDYGAWVEVGKTTDYTEQATPVGSLVEVKYLYQGSRGRLVQPNLLFIRTDVEESACRISRLRREWVRT